MVEKTMIKCLMIIMLMCSAPTLSKADDDKKTNYDYVIKSWSNSIHKKKHTIEGNITHEVNSVLKTQSYSKLLKRWHQKITKFNRK